MEEEDLTGDRGEDLVMDGMEVEARLTAEGRPLMDPREEKAEARLETALEEEEVMARRMAEDLPCSPPTGISCTTNGNSIVN
jgi:hypothetical protein